MTHRAFLILAVTTLGLFACKSSPPDGSIPPAAGPVQSEADEYTRYELLASDSHKFRITHEVSATTPDARYYYAYIRGGVFLSDVRASDLFTGERLDVELVSGKIARENGHPTADPEDSYLRINLARPVPPGGETRLEIQVIYEDPKSYQFSGDRIFFGRVLGVKRICVVLPEGHELVSVNHPAQIVTQADGRVRASLINTNIGPLSLEIVGAHIRSKHKKDSASVAPAADEHEVTAASFHESLAGMPTMTPTALVDRVHQDREVVWMLGNPATSSFVVQRESTESQADATRWLDVVRGTRRVSNPVATALDTGARLEAEVLSVEDARSRGVASEADLTDAAQVVAVTFEPLKQGATLRLRVAEDVVDSDAYSLAGDELVFAAELTVARSRVVLPKGWFPTESAIPARVVEMPEGRTALEFFNTSPTALEVSVRARKGGR